MEGTDGSRERTKEKERGGERLRIWEISTC